MVTDIYQLAALPRKGQKSIAGLNGLAPFVQQLRDGLQVTKVEATCLPFPPSLAPLSVKPLKPQLVPQLSGE